MVGDVMAKLAEIESDSVDCVITSPPYWNLRDYGMSSQIGLEKTPDLYIGNLRMIFEQVRRVLKPKGTLWLNLGDSYASAQKNRTQAQALAKTKLAGGVKTQTQSLIQQRKITKNLKAKNLAGIPWRTALALQSDGWNLRQDIIWHKTNPMPESVTDRCVRSHEYIFLLTKSSRYFFDHKSIQEPAVTANELKWAGDKPGICSEKSWRGSGKSTRRFGRNGKNSFRGQGHMRPGSGPANRPGRDLGGVGTGVMRNKRSVWTVSTKPFKGAHFATFPPDLIEPAILAGCPAGGVILDPFFGSGTVGVVASKFGRKYIGIELNPKYAKMAKRRIAGA